jgi:surface polysaccharide O-acyltransferase-like enzyme
MNPAAHPAAAAAPRARNAYLDTLRGAAIFGVVCIHFGGSFVTVQNAWTPSFYLGLVVGQLFNFAVPVFIFISGVLAGFSSARPSVGAYYRSRLVRIGLPYLAASIASFFLLNHYETWQALPGFNVKLGWLAQRLCYLGVEPTLYFIPLILQLYLLQPFLAALPRWIQRATGGAVKLEPVILGLALLFLALHVVLGVLCYRGILSYYYWCRPCALFWLCYFFSGLHFKALISFFSRRTLLVLAGAATLVALGALVADFRYLTDRSAVGAHFELNNMDWAYARPPLLVYDLAMVAMLSVGIALGWSCRASIVSFLGPYTLEIYLWHILLLYEGAWRHAEALESCRQMPEVILLIAAFACLLLAGAKYGWTAGVALVRQYRLVLVRNPW